MTQDDLAQSAHGETEQTAGTAVHHETSDINSGAVLAFGAGLVVVALCVHILILVLFKYFEAREARRQTVEYPLAAQAPRLPPEPRLQTNPRQDLLGLRAEEEAALTTYGWADRNAGTVRIPIDKAMSLTVQRGLPARQPSR
jgi:hypothetical protein